MSGYLRMLDGNEYRVGEAWPPIECFRCGICCTCYQPRLASEEIEAIARGLGLSIDDFLSQYAQLSVVGYLLRQTERGCVFLSWKERGTADCSIYPFRPEACRNWVPSLSRRECKEGLTKIKAKGRIMLSQELYSSPEAAGSFYLSLIHLLKPEGKAEE